MTANFVTPHIVIVGGGAGGIELAARLGRKLGKCGKASITLIDSTPTHLWKPLLHEVAAGVLNSNEDELNYMAYASTSYFQFSLGSLVGLNRTKKEIILGSIQNSSQQEVIPQRTVSYDVLILAVGSVANDFGIPGVREHCLFLDSREQADYFHKNLLNHLMRIPYQKDPACEFNIAVVGGGATGIELISELHNSVRQMAKYGLDINPDVVKFTLIEAAKKLLPVLPDRLSQLVLDELKRLNVKVELDEQVSEVTSEGLKTKSGKFIPANIKVWTAGIKAPDFLKNLDGLEVNRANQLLVKQTLQTTLDDSIFAMGDCSSCPQSGSEKTVPPRAQAAHQEAVFLIKALDCYFKNKPLPVYHYHDYGSLVTLSHYQIAGSLMGKLLGNIMVEGKIARFFYWSLYKHHQTALYGIWRVMLLTIANAMSRKVRPRLKLH